MDWRDLEVNCMNILGEKASEVSLNFFFEELRRRNYTLETGYNFDY